jgi:cell division initiation protein
MQLSDFTNRSFNKGLRGYDVQEVDSFVSDLLSYCQTLTTQVNALEKKLAYYEDQEELLKTTLVTAEQTAAVIKYNAANKAKSIQAMAEKKALELIKNTESETKAYRENIHKCFFSYERELRLVLDRFYALARTHMEALENEFAEEIRATVANLDNEFNINPRLKLVADNSKTESKSNSFADNLKERETATLLGRVLKKDIVNAEGHLLAKKNTVITPELISSFIGKGLYGELIGAAEQ